jgi:hypothetical protein
MLVGINYPWIDYGWDFGDPPHAWVPPEELPAWLKTKRKQIETDFRLLASQGIFAVRWFLLADGLNYGIGEFAPRQTGEAWTFDPLPAGHSFYERLHEDFEFVLKICRFEGLKLFPSLIDFYWCREGTPVAGSPGIVKGGRQDIVRDPEKRQVFLDRILEPLLESSARYRDSVYAWELINEPEWAVRKSPVFKKKGGSRRVSREEMKEFIAEGIRRINAKRVPDGSAAFPSSVGFAHWESLDEWDVERLGITLHQFHYYAQRHGSLPGYQDLKIHPCVVGEFATAAGREWPELKLLNRDQSTANRLCCIEDKGYPACFMWSAKAVDRATRWTEEEQRQVIAYTGLNRPDGLRG